MIRIEYNPEASDRPELEMTNRQLYTIGTLMARYGWGLDYEITFGWSETRKEVVQLWVHRTKGHPHRIHIDAEGTAFITEEATWMPRGEQKALEAEEGGSDA